MLRLPIQEGSWSFTSPTGDSDCCIDSLSTISNVRWVSKRRSQCLHTIWAGFSWDNIHSKQAQVLCIKPSELTSCKAKIHVCMLLQTWEAVFVWHRDLIGTKRLPISLLRSNFSRAVKHDMSWGSLIRPSKSVRSSRSSSVKYLRHAMCRKAEMRLPLSAGNCRSGKLRKRGNSQEYERRYKTVSISVDKT